MSCQWQMGMLALRACGAPAMGGCSLCGRTLCAAHTVMGQSGPACPGCASSHEGYESNEDTELASTRDEYYRPYGGVAGFGQPGFFSGGDAAAMNRPMARPSRGATEDYDAMET